nr:TIGR03936 family radical SAM-associated protein [Lachnospiraceae bacterium]
MREFYDYRLKFSKNGPIRFVGHLDVMRYMQKANRRAKLPMRYSEGFSPHQIMSFALPLSVGATSDGEYLDMSLTRELPPEEIVEELNKVMHEGIEAKACELLPEHASKAMTVIAAAKYRLTLRDHA